MTERLKVHAWKACVLERVPRVRIPLSPPLFLISFNSFLVNQYSSAYTHYIFKSARTPLVASILIMIHPE